MRFLLLYALAAAGGATAYIPFLTVLLPVKIALLSAGQNLGWLARLTFFGAVTASLSNILFGWLSDRTHNRTWWIAGGLVGSCLLLIAIGQARSFAAVLVLLIGWQIALNMMLAPLSAWAGDLVPDHQKGFLGGLLACSPAAGALCGAMITIPDMAEPQTRLFLVVAVVAAMVLPVLLFGQPRPMPALMQEDVPSPRGAPETLHIPDRAARAVLVRMWASRLLVQIAEAALFAFLYFWLVSIDPEIGDNGTANVFGIVLTAAIPFALLVGRWSDRRNRPILPLGLAALFGTAGLLVMAAASDFTGAVAGYALFGLATAIFLSLHSSQTLRVLQHPARRGRDLAFFNLTNTVPSLIIPWLTLALVPHFGFSALFLSLAALLLLASALLVSIAKPNRAT